MKKETLIFREGEQGDALYIIAEGSVRVLSYGVNGEKITLACLNKGDYFGETALLGKIHQTRSANTETITDTSLIKITYDEFKSLFKEDKDMVNYFSRKSIEQSFSELSLAPTLYKDIHEIIANTPDFNFKEFLKDNIIFKLNDPSDYIYVILQGEVEIQVPDKASSKMHKIILHKGHFFGELGVLENKPRSATAIAKTNIRLLTIEGPFFHSLLSEKPIFKQFLNTLRKVYQLPTQSVEQYIRSSKEKGAVIVSIFKRENGTSIISSHFIDKPIFDLTVVGAASEKVYKYEQQDCYIELSVFDSHLIGIKAMGIAEGIPILCQKLFSGERIESALLEKFQKKNVTKKRTTQKTPPT